MSDANEELPINDMLNRLGIYGSGTTRPSAFKTSTISSLFCSRCPLLIPNAFSPISFPYRGLLEYNNKEKNEKQKRIDKILEELLEGYDDTNDEYVKNTREDVLVTVPLGHIVVEQTDDHSKIEEELLEDQTPIIQCEEWVIIE